MTKKKKISDMKMRRKRLMPPQPMHPKGGMQNFPAGGSSDGDNVYGQNIITGLFFIAIIAGLLFADCKHEDWKTNRIVELHKKLIDCENGKPKQKDPSVVRVKPWRTPRPTPQRSPCP